MANLVLVAEAVSQSSYQPNHIRYLVREGLVQGKKVGGVWLVDLDDLKAYEAKMTEEGAQKFDPTRRSSGRKS
jgi:hypothetical protein